MHRRCIQTSLTEIIATMTNNRHTASMAGQRNGFTPPPHENAETHARVMARLEKMDRDELIASSVRAGIRTPDGQLTAPYRSDDPQAVRK